MSNIADTRHKNLLILVDEAGDQAELARATGISPAYISQLVSRAKTLSGGVRNIGDATAAKLEAGMGKEPGWLDQADLSPDERKLLSLFRSLPAELHSYALLRIEKLRAAVDE